MAQLVKALIVFITIVILADVVIGVNYTVGGPNGSWDLDTDYKAWAKSHVFRPGDFLIFKYDDTQHDVAEVGRKHFHACNGTQSYYYDMSGYTPIKLNKPGKRYFICTVPQHCTIGGMKLEINISRSEPDVPPPPEMENVTSMTDRTPENPFPEKTSSNNPPASPNSTSSSTALSIPPSPSPIPPPSSSGHTNDSKIAPPPPLGVREKTLDDDDDDSGNSPSSISERPPPPPPYYPPIGSPGYYTRVLPPESDILFLLDHVESAVSEIRVGTFASVLVGLLMLVLVF